jgi:hypothetical protein
MRNPIRPTRFPLRHTLLVLATALTCGHALAQWQWVDASGRKVFSDTAPPQGIPEKNILKRPNGAAAVLPQASPAPTPSEAAAEIKPSGVDPKLEAKRKEAERAEAAKRKEAEDKLAKARAENCTRAKNAKATMNMGTRVMTVDSKGERTFLDDAARAAEIKRLDGIIALDCGPMAANTAGTGPKAVP